MNNSDCDKGADADYRELMDAMEEEQFALKGSGDHPKEVAVVDFLPVYELALIAYDRIEEARGQGYLVQDLLLLLTETPADEAASAIWTLIDRLCNGNWVISADEEVLRGSEER